MGWRLDAGKPIEARVGMGAAARWSLESVKTGLLARASIALAFWALPAMAGEREHLRLVYRAPEGASCPDEAFLP